LFPEILKLGPMTIRAYGLMLALSFFAGILYVQRLSVRTGKPFEPFLAIAYIMIGGGVIGARVSYVFLHLSDFADNWTASFNPFASDQFGIAGLNLYGGVFLALAGTLVYCRLKKLSVLDMFDYFAPTLGIGLVLTRIGCFLNGCCFGTPTDLPWGVVFPAGSIPCSVFGEVHLHPAQLYSSLYGLGLALLLHFMLKHRKFIGQIVAVLFMVEAVFRFAIEYVRYYETAMHFSLDGLSPTYNQVASAGLFALGVAIYLYQRGRPEAQVQ